MKSTTSHIFLFVGLALAHIAPATFAQAPAPASVAVTPVGVIKGDAWEHSRDTLAASVEQADVCLPASVTGGAMFVGKFKDIPKTTTAKAPTILFMHGSSGLGLKAIGEWQLWLCGLGYASVAPNSFTLPNRATYTSPIDKDNYERMHALRASEIAPTLAAIKQQAWADTNKLVLAGTSEGSVPVARYSGTDFAAKIMYAWSCEPNYFTKAPLNAFEPNKPVLNVISSTDPFFSKTNIWIGNADAQGHCGAVLAGNAKAAVVLIPNAPHTLLNFPAARHATAGFLAQLKGD